MIYNTEIGLITGRRSTIMYKRQIYYQFRHSKLMTFNHEEKRQYD